MSRVALRSLGALLAVLAVAGGCSGRPRGNEPNIILIMYDDADAASMNLMPNIKRLIADEGVTFDRFYVTQPLCCPSRASLLTGEYVHNHLVRTNGRPFGGFEEFLKRGHEARTVARVLQGSGYATGLFGKYLNGYSADSTKATRHHRPPFWDRWFGKLGTAYANFGINDDGRVRKYGASHYADRVITRESSRWIGDMSKEQRPFFAYITPMAPHVPYVDPPEHQVEFEKEPPLAFSKPSFDESDVSDKPALVRKLPRLTERTKLIIQQWNKHRLRMMLGVDDYVGRLVAKLETTGEIDRTYIFVTSDNGWLQGEHRAAAGKVLPYEESVRLPLIVRGPGVRRGVRVSALTSMIDLYPTFAELAGGRADRDGRSLVSLLRRREAVWPRKQLLVESLVDWHGIPRYRELVTNRYKLIAWGTGERELYDLKRDPYELDGDYRGFDPVLVEVLSKRLDAMKTCRAASCRVADAAT